MIKLHDKEFKLLLSAQEIDQLIQTVAEKINHDYQDSCPLFVGILNGSFMFASDLMKKITVPCELSFVKFSSYVGTKSTGKIDELIGFNDSVKGRDLILVEDIVDTGETLEKVLNILQSSGAKSIRIATLLLKPEVFDKKYPVDYVCKNIPNKFVVGFGLDYDQLGRNYGEIYQLAEEN